MTIFFGGKGTGNRHTLLLAAGKIVWQSENIILQTRNLKKYYGKGETQVHALDCVNL